TAVVESRNHNWSAEGPAKIILPFRRLLAGRANSADARAIKPISGIEYIIAQILEGGPMELIGPRACDYRDLAARLAAIFSRISRSLNFEFLESIDGYQALGSP